MTFSAALFLLFLGLKLGHVIDWSWWWVTAPLWIGAAFAVVLLTLQAFIVGAAAKATRRSLNNSRSLRR